MSWAADMRRTSRDRLVPIVKKQLASAGLELRWARTPRAAAMDAILTTRDLEARGTEGVLGQRDDLLEFMLANRNRSHGQRFQDLFVLYCIDQPGFFVEFGAADGIRNSNTYLLERECGWQGIAAEPARVWHDELRKNRACIIDDRCVSGPGSDDVEFVENVVSPQFSALREAKHRTFDMDDHNIVRTYRVPAITLNQLLADHDAPTTIDFLSVDTEGTEFAILNSFDFAKYRVRILSVEHNGEPQRSALKTLLEGHGLRRIYPDLSAHDDWYVAGDIAEKLATSG